MFSKIVSGNKKEIFTFIAGSIVFGFFCFFSYVSADPQDSSQNAGSISSTPRVYKMEMVDSETGDIYCTWIKKGQWQQVRGLCDSSAAESMFGQATGWSAQQASSQSQDYGAIKAQIKEEIEKELTKQIKAEVQSQINNQQQSLVPAEQPAEQAPAVEEQAPVEAEEQPAEQAPAVEEQAPVEAEEQPAEQAPLSFGGLLRNTTAGLTSSIGEFVTFILSPLFKTIGNIIKR